MITSLPRPLRAFVLVALSAALAVGCGDDNPAVSKRPLLVDKTWVAVRYLLGGEDVTNERELCELDDATTFFADGTFIEDIGNVACEETEENTHGTWEFKANETILSMRATGETASDWNLVVLTEDSLKISQYAAALKMEIVVVMAPL
jgi:hypothetical protein